MTVDIRRVVPLAFITLVAVGRPVSASAAGKTSIAGEYVCAWGCRLTDAAPGIEMVGDSVHCMNEFGGIYFGRRLTEKAISCFNKTGTVSEDGKTILWSDGVIWRRR